MKLLLLAGLTVAGCAFGQTATLPSTRLAQGINADTTRLFVTDPSVVQSPGLPFFREPGDPVGGPGPTYLFSEQEAMRVVSVIGNVVSVQRGVQGTYPAKHNLGMMVFAAPGHYYNFQDAVNPCLADQLVLPWLTMPTGKIWNCYTGGTRPGINWAQAKFAWNSTGPEKAQQPWTDSTLLCQAASFNPVVFFPDLNISPCITRKWLPGVQWTESNFTWDSQGATWNALLNIS